MSEIRQFIIDGQSIQVVHSQTGQDLTRSILVQVLSEMEQEGNESVLTDRVLIELIKFYGDPYVGMMRPFIEQQLLHSFAAQDRIREHIKQTFESSYPATSEQAIRSMIEQYQAYVGMSSPVPDEEVDTTGADDGAHEK